jgi:hypothetical protein
MTLIELMVAFVVGALLMAGARMLFAQLQVADSELGRAARDDDQAANAMHLLYALTRRAEVRQDSSGAFAGDTASAAFRSACDRPGGWLEPCSVAVRLTLEADSSLLSADLSTGERFVLARWPGRALLRYVEVTATGERWSPSWGRSIAPPAAMAIVLSQDTVVLPIAGR